MTFNAFAFIAAFALLRPAMAQEVRIHSGPYRPPATSISVQTNLVEIAATVRDRKGAPVDGLQSTDFHVLDNDTPRTISFFSEQRNEAPATSSAHPADQPAQAPSAAPAAPPPRYLALFIDDAHSAMAGFERSKHAAEKLIATGLHPGARVGIFTASGVFTLDFTADTAALLAALKGLKWRPESASVRGIGVCPTLTTYQAYVITKHLDNQAKQIAIMEILACDSGKPYWVAAVEAQEAGEDDWEQLRHEPSRVLDVLTLVARHLAAQPGTRILLMVSPGFLTDGMDRQKANLVETCLRNRIVINALDDEGLLSGGNDSPESLGQFQGPRNGWANSTLGQRNLIVQGFMVEATESTGGQFIHNNNDLNGGLEALATPPRFSYTLGISPTGEPDGKYHKLKVSVTKAGNYSVSARTGYFATPPEKSPETAQQLIDRVAGSADTLAEIPATVSVKSAGENDGRMRIQVEIAVDAKGLKFSEKDGASVQQLTFVTILEDAQGNYVEGKQAEMDLNLTAKTRTDLEAHGIKADTFFVAPKGSYQIREVVREAVNNRIAASTHMLEASGEK